MIIVTTNDLPLHKITKVIGEVSGMTVRTRNVVAQIGSSFRAIAGGELPALTQQLAETREEAVARMTQAAFAQGANAIIAMRFDSNEINGTMQEVLAYGTAVVVEPIG